MRRRDSEAAAIWRQAREVVAHARGDPGGADALMHASYHPNIIPAVSQLGEQYSLPPSSPVTIHYTGLTVDAIEDALQRSTDPANLAAFRTQHPEGENLVIAYDVDRPFTREYRNLRVRFKRLDSFARTLET